ncbi:hypothetical protein JCM17380_43380 [Desulfosporosinus burensis]|uniref:hypothetical protein n=1 Tax=Desulfosporosinus sp. BICA1-9 TaxID=1531958 RepID=UPI00054BAAE4|nr:hypothetical protein [Desulfosporosinus sp. BICA1-9]KJS47797.1 MAG: hypothetical protein VR66_17600 [Peptococcaceae bacterium BRH_c23]KJS89919.1 MAG: hypothetical protein JL57_04660 [Desulfosporosinus sp. BICA1-9]HBW35096.1 hypothetical protein [Desulfosporosinus sp.]
MKKLWSSVLVSLMIISSVPVNAMADTSDVNINRLSYINIEEKIEAFNPTVRANNKKLSDARDINDSLKLIEGTESKLKATIGELSGYFTDEELLKGVSKPINPVLSNPQDLSDTLKYVNYNLYMLYQAQLGNLTAQKASLSARKDDMWKSYLQISMGNKQVVWGTQQMFLSYQELGLQTEALRANRANVENQVKIMKLQEELGIITPTDYKDVELQLRELDVTIKSLKDTQDTLKGSLNLFFGQEFDTNLIIEEVPAPDFELINKMDYDEDIETAIANSYMVRVQEEAEDRDSQTRQVKMDFDLAFKDVKTKQESLEREKIKFKTERVKWDHQQLRYNLGMIPLVAFNVSKTNYDALVRKVITAETDLVKSLTAYDWLLEGISVITNTSKKNS